jgi:hypothetical protein
MEVVAGQSDGQDGRNWENGRGSRPGRMEIGAGKLWVLRRWQPMGTASPFGRLAGGFVSGVAAGPGQAGALNGSRSCAVERAKPA